MPLKIKQFSKKQLEVLSWWHSASPCHTKDAIICDGAVRSGKTLSLSLYFVLWAFERFREENFALCGKTIGSLRRNVIRPLLSILESMGFSTKLIISRNLLEIRYQGVFHRFHLFGGKDEGSASLIQGITLAGVLFDEVALMPRSFVEQALARCSVEQAKFWFNCNPEHPSHWFYKEWIEKSEEKNAQYLHFTMEDNPSLSPAVLQRYRALYSGVFYRRYVLGEWVAAHGAVYPMFDVGQHVVDTLPEHFSRYVISCDYGTSNPSSFGLWGHADGIWYRIREYYHSSREDGNVKTDEEYCYALEELAGQLPIEAVLVDPSAASFIQCIRRRGRFSVLPAENSVLNGIRLVSSALSQRLFLFHSSCKRSIEEFSLYRWNLNSSREEPLQVHDHAMDEIRYFAQYINQERGEGFFALSTARRR